MHHKILRNTPVWTKNGLSLGNAHAYHHRVNTSYPDIGLHPSYLMVINLTIGDDFYIPLTYIDDEKTTQDEVWLSITDEFIQQKQYTRLPVDDEYRHEELPLVEGRNLVDDVATEEEELSETSPPPSQV